MPKTSSSKEIIRKKTSKKDSPSSYELRLNRRKEWRFELPLSTIVEGELPKGKNFQEATTLENISSGGAYFCLDSGVIVGSKINLVIELPDKLTSGKGHKLCLGGITIRLEKAEKKGKHQGVAIRFSKDFKIISEKKRNLKR